MRIKQINSTQMMKMCYERNKNRIKIVHTENP